ncbi:heparan sulfate glucosamine 3-O-sulfotransferase 1-like [Acanthaster planci]|uniref:Heparan sulfate glucosamine 3-O-sulfotransferase 1-like n=1 Tax=Acanthaster planci TaxID=133434 RepID=A0A8B7YL94_ACAPL|nr:heparan sulfate glucosamine 3-O-sulfotransferase 1-like [Acanthaster planci]
MELPMQIRSNILRALAFSYLFSMVTLLVYLMYSATVNLPSLPEGHSIYWWRDASYGRYILRHTCIDSDVVCDECCYCYTPASHILADFGELSQASLTQRRCEKRLPQAIIIGAMKSGTYALRTYLSYHPHVAMAYDEPWFWNKPEEFDQGLERYRRLMHYSTPGQVTMEKTPDYYHAVGVPENIAKHLPDAKILMIMKDPVKRAISHYNFERLRSEDSEFPATFEQAVLTADGRIDEHSKYISWSGYSTFVRLWLRHFPPQQFLAIDGDPFIRNPLPQLQRIEKFLGIRPFFSEDIFTKNTTSGFWCLTKPIVSCVPQSRPHPPHPKVSDSVLTNLYQYFRPLNKQLANLLKEPSFEWCSY